MRPVASAVVGWAHVIGLVDVLEHRVLVHGDETLRINAGDDVLLVGRLRP